MSNRNMCSQEAVDGHIFVDVQKSDFRRNRPEGARGGRMLSWEVTKPSSGSVTQPFWVSYFPICEMKYVELCVWFSGLCFSDFNVLTWSLGILLNCSFSFSRSGVGLELWLSHELPAVMLLLLGHKPHVVSLALCCPRAH